MKTLNNKAFLKQLSAFKLKFKAINAMASVKGGLPLVRIAVMLIPVIGWQTTSAKVRSIVVFLRHIHFLFRNNGSKGACLILKVYAVTLQQSIGGHVVKDLTELKFRVSRTNRGLPRIIPTHHRQMIRAGDPAVIRFYLSLFNFYRMIEFTGDMRLVSLTKSIISPANVKEGFLSLKAELLAFIPLFYKKLVTQIGMNPISLRKELLQEYKFAKAFPLLKSSPFTMALHKFEDLTRNEQIEQMITSPVISTHPLAIHEAANALENNAELYGPSHYFLGLLPNGSVLREAWRKCVHLPLKGGVQAIHNPFLGKLALKEESAGKVRVFAMVDCWTQWLLKPLHDTIFDHILAGISQDGTRDQMAPVYRLLKSSPKSLFSLDLSAATDRLPIWLQEALLAGFTGEIYSRNWVEFLVNRDYVLTLMNQNEDKPVRYRIRYAVGQPMGALSSWAMLAFTHHFIVQFAAYQSGESKGTSWFQDYAVLGDDIVIGNAKVAKAYLRIMRVLGVGIGLHKSLISASGTALEFAKRTIFKGMDVSPITLSEFQASLNSPAGAVLFIKKYALSLQAFLKACGYKYNVLGRLHQPLGKLNSKVRLIILALNIPYSVEEVEAFFSLGSPKSGKAQFESQVVIDQMVQKEFTLLKRALNKIRNGLFQLEGAHLHAKDIARELILNRVRPQFTLQATDQELLLDAVTEAKNLLKAQGLETVEADYLIKIISENRGRLTGNPNQKGYNPGLLGGLEDLIIVLEAAGDLGRDQGEFIGMNYDVNQAQYLRTLRNLMLNSAIKQGVDTVKYLQLLTQFNNKVSIMAAAQQLSDSLVKVMLSKYDMTAKELFMSLIALSKDIAHLGLSNLQYARVVSAQERGFTDGMHIRLWKALSGIAQGTKRIPATKAADANTFNGWW
nr:putative RNA-dependent RNA polymerase [Binucleate Rhizoctonia mitovirus 9]